MASKGTVSLKDIFAMLDHCAPGHQRKQTDHNWRLTFNGAVYAGFPLGKHGRRENVPVQMGHVRHLVRVFNIAECARRHLEQL